MLRGKRIFCLALLIFFLSNSPSVHGNQEKVPELWYFWGEGCEVCQEAALWIEEMERIYPDLVVESREVWYNEEERKLYLQMMEERGDRASWVPGFILEEKTWGGYNERIAREIRRELIILFPEESHLGSSIDIQNIGGQEGLFLVGPFDLSNQPVILVTLFLAFIDGFNPCSLWVLTVLLALILNSSSRRKIIAVGAVFLVVTASIYGFFILGLFSALSIVSHLHWIRWGIAGLALLFALVNIKDFFVFGRGLSLTIPSNLKPVIIKKAREVGSERPLPIVLFFTVLFASGVALIELPCTAGFPLVWTGLVREAGISSQAFTMLLFAYLSVYLSLEVFIIIAVVMTMRIYRIQELHGRRLKLIGGLVLAAMAVVLFINPPLMTNILGLLLVIGGGIALGIFIILVQGGKEIGSPLKCREGKIEAK